MKTTTREARENIRRYIMEHFRPEGYDFTGPATFENVAAFILATQEEEKFYTSEYARAHNMTLEEVFIGWCQGLPSVLDTCYCYNRSAVDDLGDILNQSKREREKFTEEDAEKQLSHLIYRELRRAARK